MTFRSEVIPPAELEPVFKKLKTSMKLEQNNSGQALPAFYD